MVSAIEPAVRLYEAPSKGLLVETDWADVWVSAADWVRGIRHRPRYSAQ